MSGKMISCISCGSKNTQCIGTIPASDTFAGAILKSPLSGGNLIYCPTCSVSFRHPRMSKRELDLLYSSGKELNWQHSPGTRKDWQIAARWIHEDLHAGSSVLDVGCFDGEFQRELGNKFNRYGIELHAAACNRARMKGVNIIANDIDSLRNTKHQFDGIVAFDIIEHMPDPRDFLQLLSSVVRPGGIIIVATGNTLAPSWRFLGSRYWYCANAEHISFINPDWCRFTASLCSVEVQQIESYSHVENLSLNYAYKTKDLLKNVFYKYMPWACSKLRKLGAGKRKIGNHPELANSPPSWMSAKDHFITKFYKV